MGELYVKQGDEWVPVVRSGTQQGPPGPVGPQGSIGPPGQPGQFSANSIHGFSYQRARSLTLAVPCAGSCSTTINIQERKSSNWNTPLSAGTWKFVCHKQANFRADSTTAGNGINGPSFYFPMFYDTVTWTVVATGTQTIGESILIQAPIITAGITNLTVPPRVCEDWSRSGYCFKIE